MIFLSFIIGATVGSFLCLLLERGESGGVRGRSRCTKCLRTLKWYELIPVISWLVLRAKCRTCGTKLSVLYLAWEVGVGLAFVATYWMAFHVSRFMFHDFAFWYLLIRRWLFVSIWILVVASDIKSKEIPIMPVGMGIIIAILTSGFQINSYNLQPTTYNLVWSFSSLLSHLAAGLVGGIFYLVQHWWSKGRWVGEGDIWLGVWMGLILGWPLILLALAVAYIVGAVVASLLMVMKQADLKSQLPMAPFLAVGAIAVWWWAPEFCRVLFYSMCRIPEFL